MELITKEDYSELINKLDSIYYGRKENEKLTMHEIGVILNYVIYLQQHIVGLNKYVSKLEQVIIDTERYEFGADEEETRQFLNTLKDGN